MSGRKSSEVSALLARGKQAREAGEANFIKRLDAGALEIENNQKEIEAYVEKIKNNVFSVSGDCLKEFPSESKELELQIEALRAKKYSDTYIAHIKKAALERKEISNNLQRADNESDSIRQSIRHKSHYCDSEYRRADNLVAEYKKIARKRDKLVKEMDDAVKGSSSELIEFRNIAGQMEQLQEKTRQLDYKAGQIVELRKKAGEAKAYLKEALQEIDTGLAEKFMHEAYTELKKEIDRVSGLPDAEVVKSLGQASERIGIFSAGLDKCYAEFIEEQQKTEAGIRHLEDLLKADGYYEPTDYMRNTDKAKRMALIPYIKEYGNNAHLLEQIEENLLEIGGAYDNEEFAKAQDLIRETDEKIHQAMGYAVLLQENMLKNAYTAVDIRKVMTGFGYNVSANMIDGNPKNGWQIVAHQGGESINFERIYIEEDGTPTISIDHTIRPSASCHAEWEEIARAMDDTGINIKRIVQEDGTVVIDKAGDTQKNKTVSGNNGQQLQAGR